MLWAGGAASCIAGAAGLAAGLLYRIDLLGLKKLRVSEWEAEGERVLCGRGKENVGDW